MKNAYAIGGISRQLGKVCEQMDMLAMGIQEAEQNAPDIVDVYDGLLADELEHAQVLILKLTELISQDTPAEVNADEGEGSAFAAGDLTTEKTGDEGKGGEEGQE